MGTTRRDFLRSLVTGLASSLAAQAPGEAAPEPGHPPPFGPLSAAHLAAVRRRRRVIVNLDTCFGAPPSWTVWKRVA